ncbi:H+/gluconate symporter-like permease [Rhodococcus sp. 27YEA15]|uniref:GntT/GntP/DsdX family permease n=1 Tax=Rhodococcus sp. 27YEA15 TaxID=3156259 RepID=UPI003C7B1180
MRPALRGRQTLLEYLAAAICAGSVVCSHVNDGGFWMAVKFFNMTVKQGLQTFTVVTTILSLTSFAVVAVLYSLIA